MTSKIVCAKYHSIFFVFLELLDLLVIHKNPTRKSPLYITSKKHAKMFTKKHQGNAGLLNDQTCLSNHKTYRK